MAACLALAADLGFGIASSVRASAVESGDPDVAAKVLQPCGTGARIGQGGYCAAVIARLESIHEAASEVSDDIEEDYGVTAAKLAELAKRTEAFAAAHPKPRQRINAGSTATKQLKRHFAQLTVLLRERVDCLMTRFKTTNPEFYNEHKAARRIVRPGTASAGTTEKKAAEGERGRLARNWL